MIEVMERRQRVQINMLRQEKPNLRIINMKSVWKVERQSLREKCLYSEFSCFVFSRIQTQ